MSRVCTYLNLQGRTGEAMAVYRDLFHGESVGELISFGDIEMSGAPPMSAEDAAKIMHMEGAITGGHVLMATDMLESFGQHVVVGDNTIVMVELDDRGEVDRLFAALASGEQEQAPAMMPWGQYWSVCLDRFGIRWMFAAD